MIYKDSYIYPPRPENTFPRSGMDRFDNGSFLAEPKFNGSCCEVYIGGRNWKIMNRHNSVLTGCRLSKNEVESIIPNNGVNMIVGEYMNKSKRDENNNIFNHKFMIFDIIVYNNEHLIGKTFQERIDLLNNIFKIEDENEYSYKLTDNIHLTKVFYSDFGNIWDNLTKIDMIEGLVLKRKNAGLEVGVTEKNNTKSMCKCRKSTKNYSY